MSSSELILWGVSALALVVIAGVLGKFTADKGVLSILIDSRGRYSLTHFQIVLWTIVILSNLLAVVIAAWWNAQDPASLEFPPELLGLMGIAAGSAVLSTAVKGAKDAGSKANVAREGAVIFTTTVTGTGPSATITITPTTIQRKLSQIFMEEEGNLADQVISITKFQNFVFTLVILLVYVSIVWNVGGLPKLPDNIVWLIGISHAGYVGGKIPDKLP